MAIARCNHTIYASNPCEPLEPLNAIVTGFLIKAFPMTPSGLHLMQGVFILFHYMYSEYYVLTLYRSGSRRDPSVPGCDSSGEPEQFCENHADPVFVVRGVTTSLLPSLWCESEADIICALSPGGHQQTRSTMQTGIMAEDEPCGTSWTMYDVLKTDVLKTDVLKTGHYRLPRSLLLQVA